MNPYRDQGDKNGQYEYVDLLQQPSDGVENHLELRRVQFQLVNHSVDDVQIPPQLRITLLVLQANGQQEEKVYSIRRVLIHIKVFERDGQQLCLHRTVLQLNLLHLNSGLIPINNLHKTTQLCSGSTCDNDPQESCSSTSK